MKLHYQVIRNQDLTYQVAEVFTYPNGQTISEVISPPMLTLDEAEAYRLHCYNKLEDN